MDFFLMRSHRLVNTFFLLWFVCLFIFLRFGLRFRFIRLIISCCLFIFFRFFGPIFLFCIIVFYNFLLLFFRFPLFTFFIALTIISAVIFSLYVTGFLRISIRFVRLSACLIALFLSFCLMF